MPPKADNLKFVRLGRPLHPDCAQRLIDGADFTLGRAERDGALAEDNRALPASAPVILSFEVHDRPVAREAAEKGEERRREIRELSWTSLRRWREDLIKKFVREREQHKILR